MKKRWCAALLAVLMLFTLISCAGKGEQKSPETDAQTQSRVPEKKPIEADTTNYEMLAKLPFEGLAETDGAAFETLEENGELTVTAYKGDDKKVRIPEQINGKRVVGIAKEAFKDQSAMTALWIPDSVTSFGENVLLGCSSLYALRTPLPEDEKLCYLGYLFGAETYEKNNVKDLRNLDFLILGGNRAALPAFSLYDCNDLVAVVLPESIKTLEKYSLYRCESLKYLNAQGLSKLDSFAMAYCSSITELTFGAGLTEIALGALESCSALQSLTVPFIGGGIENTDYLGYVFGASAPKFSKGFYPTDLRHVKVLDGCTSVGNYAFYECASLCTVSLPEGVTSIGLRAFSGCLWLEEINLPDTVLTVGESAFAWCLSVKKADLGAALQTLGVSAFSKCAALESVALPETLKEIPASCFADCVALQSISMAGATTVQKNAFYGCNALQEATVGNDVKISEGNEALEALR